MFLLVLEGILSRVYMRKKGKSKHHYDDHITS